MTCNKVTSWTQIHNIWNTWLQGGKLPAAPSQTLAARGCKRQARPLGSALAGNQPSSWSLIRF